MRPPAQPNAARRRYAVYALFAAALVVFAVTITFGLRLVTPAVPLPGATTAIPRQASQSPGAGEIAPPPPAPPGPQTTEAPAPNAAVVPAAPELPPPATSQDSAPPASAPGLPAPTVTGPAQLLPVPPAPADREPGTATVSPNPMPAPGDDAAAETWMRKEFGQFLDQSDSQVANLSEPQRDALFAEFLAWRRTRSTADPAQPAQPPVPEDREKAHEP